MKRTQRFFFSLIYPTLFVLLLWIIKSYEILFVISLSKYGILPRHLAGLPGIFFAPLIHGDFFHLFSNTIPLLILGIIICYFYTSIAFEVFFLIYFLSTIAVWTFALGQGYHLGASGLVYGFVSFLFFCGIFRSDKRSMLLSLIVIFVYGGLIWGIFPIYEGISWESHFFGAISGGLCAYIFRRTV
jgi:membrane associated rhomboid family serine protease